MSAAATGGMLRMLRMLTPGTVLIILLTASGFGQSHAPKRPDMSREPAVGPLKPYRLGPREVSSLPSGIRLFVVEDHRFPLVNVRLAVRGGDAAGGAEDAGLADALASLLTEGAGGRTARQIAEESDAIGGDVSAAADQDTLVVSGFALSDKAERLLTLMRDVALRPDFPAAEVELRRKNMLEELRLDRSQPDFLGRLAFFKRVYPGHPYGVTEPTEASIARIDAPRLRALHARLFTPKGALLVIVGDISAAAAKQWAGARFADWPSDAPPPPQAPAVEPSTAARRVYLVDRPGSAQTVLVVGNVSITERDPGYFPLLSANEVLGGSFSSRLMQDLREKKGYTYGVRSRLAADVQAGAFIVTTQVRTEVTGAALKDLLGELERIRAEAVKPEELSRAKSFLAGSFTRRLEKQDGVADALTHALLHQLPDDFLDRYVSQVQAVTAEEALAAVRQDVRDAAGAVIIAVGDGAKIGEELKAFSAQPVQLLDLNGEKQ